MLVTELVMIVIGGGVSNSRGLEAVMKVVVLLVVIMVSVKAIFVKFV